MDWLCLLYVVDVVCFRSMFHSNKLLNFEQKENIVEINQTNNSKKRNKEKQCQNTRKRKIQWKFGVYFLWYNSNWNDDDWNLSNFLEHMKFVSVLTFRDWKTKKFSSVLNWKLLDNPQNIYSNDKKSLNLLELVFYNHKISINYDANHARKHSVESSVVPHQKHHQVLHKFTINTMANIHLSLIPTTEFFQYTINNRHNNFVYVVNTNEMCDIIYFIAIEGRNEKFVCCSFYFGLWWYLSSEIENSTMRRAKRRFSFFLWLIAKIRKKSLSYFFWLKYFSELSVLGT